MGYVLFFIGEVYHLHKENIPKSLKWYELGSERNNTECYSRLANIYQYGREGVEKDELLAVEYYSKGGDLGSAHCLFYLGLIYEMGNSSVKRNVGKCINCFERACELGCQDSMHRLVKKKILFYA